MKNLVVGTLIFGFVLVGLSDRLLSQGSNSGSDSARLSDVYLDSLCSKNTSSRLDSAAGSLHMKEWLDGLASEHLVSNGNGLTEIEKAVIAVLNADLEHRITEQRYFMLLDSLDYFVVHDHGYWEALQTNAIFEWLDVLQVFERKRVRPVLYHKNARGITISDGLLHAHRAFLDYACPSDTTRLSTYERNARMAWLQDWNLTGASSPFVSEIYLRADMKQALTLCESPDSMMLMTLYTCDEGNWKKSKVVNGWMMSKMSR